jgi:HK97 family phage prohead protease
MEKQFFGSEIKGIDDNEQTLTAYISTDTRDRHGEVLDPQGLDKKNYEKNPVVLWAHDYSQPPIGRAMWTKKDGVGVLSKVKFASTPFAQEIFQLYKEKVLNTFSVGFMPKEWEDGDGEKKPRRTYTKWELLEYSAVPVPANPDAVALAIQKGLKISDATMKMLQPKEEQAEEKAEEVINEKDSGLEEILAENDQLNEKITGLEKENGELKYKYFNLLTELQRKPPEITVEMLEAKALDILNGVIRKAQGKVD